ncbi:uncharacterized protein L969DRAFT_42306 [Mixia osmundae IAM 14324]|uniref:uncharacterized protein n=1 Tax=Mixia osmundae (strain CBS 9802 / IAM 14324 / JCM 22182 / KY 12970) TaxID=764103 RepID=UPI0004A54B7E|nr:uncharacterized protein L969DRAFT_42306 [Mixia osmundae IAM 14324]KEI41984.1 hypothetical protein L969DRAFT_42306 [Mixia osmundae IAM 14324]
MSFQEALQDLHLVYDYEVQVDGKTELWEYELWFAHEARHLAVYAIHGGPMAGRRNFQEAIYRCVRKGIWQINWLEETGTIVSIVYDSEQGRLTSLIAFSQGHWENPDLAKGDKRNRDDFARWRELAKIGSQTDRHILAEHANIKQIFRGAGTLEPIDPSWPTR